MTRRLQIAPFDGLKPFAFTRRRNGQVNHSFYYVGSRIVRKIFGWKRADGYRKYRTLFIAIPRKNGKTTFCSALALFLTIADGEDGAKVYSIAGNEEQARLLFEEAWQMCDLSPGLSECVEKVKTSIYCGDTFSSFLPLSGSGKNKHGKNPHGVFGDELHEWEGRDQFDAMRTAFGARRQPLQVYITTAGDEKQKKGEPTVCWEMWDRAKRILDGELQKDDFLPVIFAANDNDDWRSEETWSKANPSLDQIIKRDFLRSECADAAESPALEAAFRRLYLNQWSDSDKRLIPMRKWIEASAEFDISLLRDSVCIGGLDLGYENRIVTGKQTTG